MPSPLAAVLLAAVLRDGEDEGLAYKPITPRCFSIFRNVMMFQCFAETQVQRQVVLLHHNIIIGAPKKGALKKGRSKRGAQKGALKKGSATHRRLKPRPATTWYGMQVRHKIIIFYFGVE